MIPFSRYSLLGAEKGTVTLFPWVVILMCILSKAVIIVPFIGPEVIKGCYWVRLRVDLPVLHYKNDTIPSPEKIFASYYFAILYYSLIIAPTPKYSQFINVTYLGGYRTSLFKPELFNPIFSLQELFLYEDHISFDCHTFGDHIQDGLNAIFPCHQ